MMDDVYFSFFELKVSKIDKSGQFIWVLISAVQPRDYIILQLDQTSHYQGRPNFTSNKVSTTLTL